MNRTDPTGAYSCGKNLSYKQCYQFSRAQAVAATKIANGINTLQSARNKLASGAKLTNTERRATREIGRFFGSGSANIKGIDKAISKASGVLGELRSDKPATMGSHDSMARAIAGGAGITLGSKFFNAGIDSQAFTLGHEGSHTSGIAPIDFAINYGDQYIGPYGFTNAIKRAQLTPNRAAMHADTVPYAFGLRRDGDPE